MEKIYSQDPRRSFQLSAGLFMEFRQQTSASIVFPIAARIPSEAFFKCWESVLDVPQLPNWGVCSSLAHINSIPPSHDVTMRAECTISLFPALLGMQRQHWNQCKTSNETTLGASIYWKWCLMRSLFLKNISKPNVKCTENSHRKKFFFRWRQKFNFDSLLYARNVFSSYFCTKERFF